jgi:hypothetical protein
MTTDRLFVIWGDSAAGNRAVIGQLARVAGEFRFWYEDDLGAAMARGFKLLPEFPQHRTVAAPYVERYLFPLFAERIPAPSRRDTAAMMAEWGVDRPDDQFEVLAKSGGLRATDRLELAEYRAGDDALTRPLEFRLAGRRYLEPAATLEVGAALVLRREPTNTADPLAVLCTRDGHRAGYVPRQYTPLVGRLLDAETPLECRVQRQLIAPDEPGRWVVRLSRIAGER